jgi:hypothetical protein
MSLDKYLKLPVDLLMSVAYLVFGLIMGLITRSHVPGRSFYPCLN